MVIGGTRENNDIVPSNVPLPWGSEPQGPIYYTVPWAHPSPYSKRHLDRFRRFAGLTVVTDRRTDRQTDHATQSVAVGRI